jgi:CHAT domain-containing protein
VASCSRFNRPASLGRVSGALDAGLRDNGIVKGARLLWMPTSELGLIPVGLAQDTNGGERLGEMYEIVTVPSLETLVTFRPSHKDSKSPSLAAIVDPTGELKDRALPFAELEGSLIAAYFSPLSRVKLGKSDADPRSVLGALGGRSYWHFSSHGTFDWTNPRRSGLVMRGGEVLSVDKLLDSKEYLGAPRLVVLSACETGLYDIERNPNEFIGLPATFLQLGAAGVVNTLWQVDDLATALLIARFYELHLKLGLSPPAALKSAQHWLKNSTRGDLVAYMRVSSINAGIEPIQRTFFENTIKRRSGGNNYRSGSMAALIQESIAAAGKSISDTWKNRTGLNEKPFSHPIYWGAFVYTGQ